VNGRNRFGASLERARIRRQMTQEKLAEVLGVRRDTVSRWEQGSHLPGDALLAGLAGALELDLAELRKRVVNERWRRRRERSKEVA